MSSYVNTLEKLEAHITKHLGEVDYIRHQKKSYLVHVDLHHIAPTPERPFYTIVTSGMSDLPMHVPQGSGAAPRMEVFMHLPPSWPLDYESLRDGPWYWPLEKLQSLAQFPHANKTFLASGHMVRNDDTPQPFAENTRLAAVFLQPSSLVPAEFHHMQLSRDKFVRLLNVVPIYAEERELVLAQGASALRQRFADFGINEIVCLNRPNVALDVK